MLESNEVLDYLIIELDVDDETAETGSDLDAHGRRHLLILIPGDHPCLLSLKKLAIFEDLVLAVKGSTT